MIIQPKKKIQSLCTTLVPCQMFLKNLNRKTHHKFIMKVVWLMAFCRFLRCHFDSFNRWVKWTTFMIGYLYDVFGPFLQLNSFLCFTGNLNLEWTIPLITAWGGPVLLHNIRYVYIEHCNRFKSPVRMKMLHLNASIWIKMPKPNENVIGLRGVG